MRRLLPLAALVLLATSALRAASPVASEPSAFLRSYAESPVHWQLWSDAALARARAENKPVFVAIGAFTSELSRAMLKQTFSNPETAAMLNEEFVCILVDAKERPDLVVLYQGYTQHVKQLNGLPLNLWLTPELKPFEGANYLPPTEEWGKEGFLTVAKRAAAGWKADADAQRAKADEALATIEAAVAQAPSPASAADISRILSEAREAHRARFDATHGGFGDPPKHLEPELLRFLLRDAATRDLALTTLRQILQNPVRDPLDGGFFRYANDAEWRLPYFQKTLHDQARLARALLDAAQITGDGAFTRAAIDALNYALGHLKNSAAEDATREEAATYYLWTVAEIEAALGQPAATEFCREYHATAEGNLPPDALPGVSAAGLNLLRHAPSATDETSFASSRSKLLQRRAQRPGPLRDDAATSGAHGLLLGALAQAAAVAPDGPFADAAQKQYAVVREHVAADGKLLRLAGRSHPAAASDYAAVIEGLLTYHSGTKDAEALTLARALRATADREYWDAATGRYAASPADAGPAFWSRLPLSSSVGLDPIAAEALMLAAVLNDAEASDVRARLVAAIAATIQESFDAPRGDLLLALDLARADASK